MGCQLPNPLALRAGHARRGLTIVEMLVAMSITLLIMAAVVTVFANISSSVTRRRATIEMSSALRNVREVLARDLAGATCPAVPWQRPESNHGYLEIIEGPQTDYYPTPWLWDSDDSDALPDPIGNVPGIDLELSSLPGSNLRAPGVSLDEEGLGLAIGSNAPLRETRLVTDGRGLGDADDTLMLTVRNETEPFVGRIPRRGNVAGSLLTTPFADWEDEEIESSLAEVVWFAVENPVDSKRTFSFGEAGYRTIYRRALLILPSLDYGIVVAAGGTSVRAAPGTVWVMPENSVAGGNLERQDVATALGGLIAFQERFDLSVRLEWDPLLPSASGTGRWVLRANSLSDLTRRENRYEHHGYAFSPPNLIKPADNPETGPTGVSDRYYPFAAVSAGIYPSTNLNLQFRPDPVSQRPTEQANFDIVAAPTNGGSMIVAVEPDAAETSADILSPDRRYAYRPFVRVQSASNTPGTLRAILDEDGHIVHVTRGLAPFGGARRGEDVMMTDALAFDLRVYDPGAPLYAYYTGGNLSQAADQVLEPSDPAWTAAYARDAQASGVGLTANGTSNPATSASYPFRYERQGAYVDLGYVRSFHQPIGSNAGSIPTIRRFEPTQVFQYAVQAGADLLTPLFLFDGEIKLPTGNSLTRLYSTYDTWSWHYESNGLNEDFDDVTGVTAGGGVAAIDEATNGLDDPAVYGADVATAYGPDDYAERETRPPYDTALRGTQVTLRVYERDSRQIREVKVRESFVPE
ncbi:MAG: prepilin-type N-terminal cleavage/methylation domain-containing protein [Planctomycetota bacterium]